MAMRAAVARQARASTAMERVSRYFSDGTGRILSEEERAVENVYIQKMERERMEKMKKKAEKERAAAEKATSSGKKEALGLEITSGIQRSMDVTKGL